MAHSIVIFGASGDLTSRKLIPALYLLFCKGRLPDATTVVGMSRSDFSHDQWRNSLAQSTARFVGNKFDSDSWSQFAANLYYQRGDIDRSEDFVELGKFLE
ncbi:MAG: glucose-6-phosphate dehydrogenase, partial [Candidatus Marinimicrobia bacterium]|nr:glucose-6-phosphate dehydrogenase [Candidatus Neomarinimicrobiota bacterium]